MRFFYRKQSNTNVQKHLIKRIGIIKKPSKNSRWALDLRPKDKRSALPQVITPKLLHLAVNRLH